MADVLVDRVVTRAVQVRPLRVVLWVLAFPFVAVGVVAGLAVALFVYGLGAVRVGFDEARMWLAPRSGDG